MTSHKLEDIAGLAFTGTVRMANFIAVLTSILWNQCNQAKLAFSMSRDMQDKNKAIQSALHISILSDDVGWHLVAFRSDLWKAAV